jgi:hypothetical protein
VQEWVITAQGMKPQRLQCSQTYSFITTLSWELIPTSRRTFLIPCEDIVPCYLMAIHEVIFEGFSPNSTLLHWGPGPMTHEISGDKPHPNHSHYLSQYRLKLLRAMSMSCLSSYLQHVAHYLIDGNRPINVY